MVRADSGVKVRDRGGGGEPGVREPREPRELRELRHGGHSPGPMCPNTGLSGKSGTVRRLRAGVVAVEKR